MPDEKFQNTLADVVWRFHVYHQYGQNRSKAIKALAKRAPGYAPEFYHAQFELNLNLLIATIEAVQMAPKQHKSENRFVEFSDVDLGFVMNKLHARFPGQSDDFLNEHVGMTIYWFYLR